MQTLVRSICTKSHACVTDIFVTFKLILIMVKFNDGDTNKNVGIIQLPIICDEAVCE